MTVMDLGMLLTSFSQELGLNDADLCGALRIDARTLDRWRKGQTYPQHEARARLNRLTTVRDRLHETFTDAAAIRSWMTTDSRYLGGLKPAEVARAGRLDRIEAAIEALDSGAFV